MIIGCNAQDDHPEWEIGQRQHSPDIPFNPRTEYTFPKDMFEFLEVISFFSIPFFFFFFNPLFPLISDTIGEISIWYSICPESIM